MIPLLVRLILVLCRNLGLFKKYLGIKMSLSIHIYRDKIIYGKVVKEKELIFLKRIQLTSAFLRNTWLNTKKCKLIFHLKSHLVHIKEIMCLSYVDYYLFCSCTVCPRIICLTGKQCRTRWRRRLTTGSTRAMSGRYRSGTQPSFRDIYIYLPFSCE